MIIEIASSVCYIQDLDKSTNSRFEQLFSYDILGAEYSKAYKLKKWDGREYVFKNRTFPIGLLERVINQLNIQEIPYSIEDTRTLDEQETIEVNPNITLRHYQITAVKKALEERIPNFQGRMASLQLATGAGKTLVIGELINRLPHRTLVIVPSIEILRQMQKTLTDYLQYDVGIIGDSEYDVQYITVATWQTLTNPTWDFKTYLSSIDSLIIDESQHLGADLLKELCYKVPAVYRFSCSGTPFREDNADLYIEAATGPVVYRYGYSDLIKEGWLVRPRIKILRFPSKNYGKQFKYNDIYNDYVTNNEFRNKIIVEEAEKLVGEGRKVLIFVSRKGHGEELKRLSNNNFVYSNHPDRRELIDLFKTGDMKCLISTSILNEGVDIPPIDGLILAAPQKSLIATIQKIGRSLRPSEGKIDTIIIDTYDSCKYLNKASERRISFYRQEKEFVIEDVIDVSKKETLEEW